MKSYFNRRLAFIKFLLYVIRHRPIRDWRKMLLVWSLHDILVVGRIERLITDSDALQRFGHFILERAIPAKGFLILIPLTTSDNKTKFVNYFYKIIGSDNEKLEYMLDSISQPIKDDSPDIDEDLVEYPAWRLTL